MNDNDYDNADQLELEIHEAIERAKAGKATDDDWRLIEWQVGFRPAHKVNHSIEASF